MVNTTTVHPVDALQIGDRISDLDAAGAVVMIEDGRIAIAWDDMDEPAVFPVDWFKNFWTKHGYEKEGR